MGAHTMSRRIRRALAELLLIKSGLRRFLLPRLLPTHFEATKFLMTRLMHDGLHARDGLLSMVFSAEDTSRPSASLLDLALRVIDRARTIDLKDILARMVDGGEHTRHASTWPGEHYVLLGALVEVLQPKLVIEIGTAEGMSALVMKKYLPACGRLVTFDLVPWENYPNVRLTSADFADGRLTQHVEDLSAPSVFARHAALLREADLLFLDASKDGRLEQVLLDHLDGLTFAKSPLLVLDDIRHWNMLGVWRAIDRPKLDLTSFGHWSGTGLVEWLSS
jgi:predicted O-methyltransferase YrrM